MIFKTPKSDRALRAQLAELDQLRERLGAGAGTAGRWLGSLRRQWRVASAESSIEIEGFRVPEAERVALVGGEQWPDPGDEHRMALACYARAMDHVGAMADDPTFGWNTRVVLDLHFDACWFQRDRDPGRYRRHGTEVSSPGGGPPVYVGPPAERVAGLMEEVVAWLDDGVGDTHPIVRAAMAHLHMVSVHPFRDGNGRVARIVQSLVLARSGLLAPEHVSIEEYLGQHTAAYYSALQAVQGGAYQPRRSAALWVGFCVAAHIEQARRRLAQLEEAGRRWARLEALVARRGWPDRLTIALEQSLFDGVDRATYATEADVSAATASNDLRRLADAELIVRQGSGRNTRYAASKQLRASPADRATLAWRASA
ncbi:MAG TPA: Fic family protein [Solirubrobacteraceae bacterium]|nr:Fic family protein [Solirubrobacteraceae bacterium]